MRKKRTFFLMVCLAAACHSLDAKSLPEVTQAALDELGITYGVPQMNGFVFVNGRYLPPPYTVTRRGNAIFINRYQVEQPVAWSYFDSSVTDRPEATDPEELNLEGDAMGREGRGVGAAADGAPAKVSSIDALFSEDAPPTESGATTIRSIDDLFGDDGEQMEKPTVRIYDQRGSSLDDLFGDAPGVNQPAAAERPKNVTHIDDLFTDDEPPKKPTVSQFQPRIAPVQEIRPRVPQTPEQLQSKKEILKKRLDEKRESYERAIAKGELYFFNTAHNQINGNYGTARTLMEVLPGALRYSRSPSELMDLLRAGNVYFIDLTTCGALYRHKTTFPLLQQRLDNIKEMEYLKAARKE